MRILQNVANQQVAMGGVIVIILFMALFCFFYFFFKWSGKIRVFFGTEEINFVKYFGKGLKVLKLLGIGEMGCIGEIQGEDMVDLGDMEDVKMV